MRRTWPILGVKNVPASSNWYRQLLGLGPIEADSHPDFVQVRDDDEERTILVCLHEWGAHEEGPPLQSPDTAEPGNGLLLSFLVEDFEGCLQRARAMAAVFHEESEYSDGWFSSFVLRDPDGYYAGIYSHGRHSGTGGSEPAVSPPAKMNSLRADDGARDLAAGLSA